MILLLICQILSFLVVIKKKEPLPLRGSKPSTYTVDSQRDAAGKKGVFLGGPGGAPGGRILLGVA